MLLLTELMARCAVDWTLVGDGSVAVTGMTADSREVVPGSLFVAMPGVSADGVQFIPAAIAAGALAVVVSSSARIDIPAPIAVLRAYDMRAAVSALAAAFYPESPRYMMAVTGTDGKTSTAEFVRQLATLSGHTAASIGTLGLRSPDAALNAAFPAHNTSPEPILLRRTLQQLSCSHINYVAMEASSHGLDQKRMEGVAFCAAAFTNFTRDHLDYHGTIEAYFAAKARLFSELLPAGSRAVLNADDARFSSLQSLCVERNISVTSFGHHAQADYRIVKVTPQVDGLSARIVLQGTTYDLALPLYGAFQLSNMLAAMGLLTATGMAADDMVALLPKLSGVPGRLERIATVRGAPVFVDYAHTPAALENILKTLRPHTQKQLHVVFGCGGDRDAGKRPEMGEVAARLADRVIVTDDNPRSEDPASIRAAILAHAPGATEIADREAAIVAAIQELQAGDVLVIAGKGHETTQTIGTQVIHFNDAEHIRKAVAA